MAAEQLDMIFGDADHNQRLDFFEFSDFVYSKTGDKVLGEKCRVWFRLIQHKRSAEHAQSECEGHRAPERFFAARGSFTDTGRKRPKALDAHAFAQTLRTGSPAGSVFTNAAGHILDTPNHVDLITRCSPQRSPSLPCLLASTCAPKGTKGELPIPERLYEKGSYFASKRSTSSSSSSTRASSSSGSRFEDSLPPCAVKVKSSPKSCSRSSSKSSTTNSSLFLARSNFTFALPPCPHLKSPCGSMAVKNIDLPTHQSPKKVENRRQSLDATLKF